MDAPKLKLVAKIGVSAVLFLVAVRLVDFGQFADVLRSVQPAWLAAAVLGWIAYQAANAWLAAGLLEARVSAPKVWRVNLISTYFGLFLPGDAVAGIASRLRYLGLPSWKHVAVLSIAERLIVLGVMSAAALGLLRFSNYRGELGGILVVGAGIILCGSVVGLWLLRSARVRSLVRRLLGSSLLALPDGFSPRITAASIVLAAAVAASSGLVAYLVLRGLSAEVSYADAFVFSFASTCVTLLPISFAGIGVRDLSAIALLGAVGVSREAALLSSLVGLLLLVCSAIVGGLIQILEERRLSK